jgi:thiamine biosynthesis protein ThiS
MQILVNGDKPIELSENSVLSEIFPRLGIELNSPGIAIAVNGRIISKSLWQTHTLQAGDKVEVVRAFQGG